MNVHHIQITSKTTTAKQSELHILVKLMVIIVVETCPLHELCNQLLLLFIIKKVFSFFENSDQCCLYEQMVLWNKTFGTFGWGWFEVRATSQSKNANTCCTFNLTHVLHYLFIYVTKNTFNNSNTLNIQFCYRHCCYSVYSVFCSNNNNLIRFIFTFSFVH